MLEIELILCYLQTLQPFNLVVACLLIQSSSLSFLIMIFSQSTSSVIVIIIMYELSIVFQNGDMCGSYVNDYVRTHVLMDGGAP